jgi:hypothetical protein
MPFLPNTALPASRRDAEGTGPAHGPTADPVVAAIERLWSGGALGVPFAHGARLLDRWRDACGGRDMPAPRDLDLATVPDALGWLVLIDAPGTPAGPRYRLFGARVAAVLGADRAGRSLLRPADRFDVAMSALAAAVAERRAPVLRRAEAEAPDGPVAWALLGLPLGGGDGVRRVVVAAAREGVWV